MIDSSIYDQQRHVLEEVFDQTIQETDPGLLVKEAVSVSDEGVTILDDTYSLHRDQNIWILGTGKASATMAESLEEVLGDRIKDGIIISPPDTKSKTETIQQFNGSHPIPDRKSESATYELLNLARKIPRDDLVIYCLSGGTSSLLCMPSKGLELEDLQATYQLMLRSGADIKEINTVRKHLSDVKGGQLLHHLKDTRLVDLVISDVPGDTLEDIGSGPTTPDSTTFQEAFQILKKYRLWEDIPHAVRMHIAKGMHHEMPDTPKPGSDLLINHQTHILGSARKAAETALKIAESEGYSTWIDSEAYNGDVDDVSRHITDQLLSVLTDNTPVEKPAILVFYGESTVEVTGNGLGGRNQELALRSSILIHDRHYISLLSAGTDGRDGPTDAAGAICNGNTVARARELDYEPEIFLENNDSYHFFDMLDQLLKTGPTGNNVMDLQIAVIEQKE